ncbi:MAG TPA: DNA repair protein RecN [Flavobacteriales bacterium]|jgi:DNA repair protein RecN (Recombination protein N)|nr:DNA repair protein RecN [Flavobacteriales bacterium]HIL66618.1 DNA repair protein RecN [Flavobacteriales bacterium]|tara:strand:- start:3903 stop:5555 length:1653 start_codon:yes stop_codon:yes gene_type:complete
MLETLFIKNYALIDEFSVQFQDGFNVISGETGAGKSIMLGGLSLILGQRADTAILNNPQIKCIIEGKFKIEEKRYKSFFQENNLDFEKETILRREITPSGKSRAFINDTPVKLSILKSFCQGIIEVHSQHQSLALKDTNNQLLLLDQFCRHNALLQEYKDEYSKFLQLKRQLKSLNEKGEVSLSELEFLTFQLDELENANLQEGEMQEVEDELAMLNNAEQIANVLDKGVNFLEKENGALDLLSEIVRDLSEISDYNKKLFEINERFEKTVIELKDISTELFSLKEQSVSNPDRLNQLNARLDIFNSLLLKHRKNLLSELVELKEDLQNRLNQLSNYDTEIENLKNEVIIQEQKIRVLAKKISKNRKSTIPDIENQIKSILKRLGMPFAVFSIEIKELDILSINGEDEVVFLFSANKGIKAEKLSSIISGGELSRLMLAIKYISAKYQNTETLIFDEIDSGVSGEIANLMGEMMKKIGEQKQLIAVTHLPQIAAKGNQHYLIYKEIKAGTTNTLIKELKTEERINELAKLLSGEKITATAIKNAGELLNQ